MKKIVLLLMLVASVFAGQMGELSLILMQDGKPLGEQNIVIYKQATPLVKVGAFVSDKDGFVHASLEEGQYQFQLVAKNAAKAQVFVRKNFVIKALQESQLIVALTSDNAIAFEDDESPSAAVQDNNVTTIKEDGFVGLSLRSAENEKPVAGARIFIKGMGGEFSSNKDGYVEVKLPEGEHTFSIIHSDFSAQTIQVKVLANEMLNRSVELSPAAMELEEFVVLAPNVEGSVASVMAEEKNSESIASVIGSEQMSKQGDSNAASALKRVAGITLMGGKYIYVRGLGDRYSSTELNGMSLPSPNPIKRTVPLDMFPSGVIGSMQVQKSFSPDITGAFGGGYVNIRTKQKSDEDYAKIKIGVSAHGTLGEDVTTYKGSDTDWTGVDSSYRPFPNVLKTQMTPVLGEREPSLTLSASQLQAMTTTRTLAPESSNVPFGTNVAIEASQGFTLGDKHEFHVLANYEYKTQAQSRKYTSYDYLISRYGVQTPTPDNTAQNDVYRESIQHGGMLNLSYGYENFDIRYTKLYVQNTLNQARDIEGTFGENNSAERQNYFEWQERTLDIDQINGGIDYTLWFKNRFDFGAEMASAKEYVPNDVYYNYRKLSTSSTYIFAPRQSELNYTNRSTDDVLTNAYIKNKTTFELLSEEDYIEVGATVENKEREGRINRLRIQSSITDADLISGSIDTILNYNDPSKLSYDITSKPKDQYDASLDRTAVYLKSMLKPTQDLEIIFGMRKVDVHQEVNQWALINNLVATETNTLDFSKNLPALSMKYALDDSNQLKFAYAQTFVFPDFREFVNSEFTHPEFLATIAGNPHLIETDITSYDLQYGYYFDDIDNITFSLFYKEMQNPIEDVQTFTTSTLDRYSFENSASAELYGIELSWYKNLGFMWEDLENVVFSGNYTYIDSSVVLTPEQKAKFVTQDRGLQGLSPEVINLSLTYQNDARSLNLAYNKMSERLMRVALKNGDVIYALDDYEVPPHILDFTWIEKFRSDFLGSDISMSLQFKNILDGETIWKQGDLTTLKYKTGRSASLSLSAKF